MPIAEVTIANKLRILNEISIKRESDDSHKNFINSGNPLIVAHHHGSGSSGSSGTPTTAMATGSHAVQNSSAETGIKKLAKL